ncbi:MAG TPA: AAA family ATPase, partial [Kofleriaceae bacterium]|nr:AAA family ATPase [Kofleriaceae bacterium]
MLVGRDRELGELSAALASGRGALFLLADEPGIGKTRLATEACEVARDRSMRVAWGRCWEAGGAPAFWPWREAFDALGVAFPDARALTTGDPIETRFTLFREIAAALAREASRAPIVIVLEDLHAADHSSLLLLELIAGQLRTMPVIVIGTYRPLEASLRPECGDALARLGRTARVLPLAPLAAPEVAALVKDALDGADDALAASVFATTQGNPLFVDEIVRDLRARGRAAPSTIPLGVREIIRQRLGLVSAEARRALEAAAVLGVELDPAIVERMIAGAGALLDDARKSGLAIADGRRLRFTHALYREALYHDLARPQREALHRDAARALTAAGAPLVEIAHHLLEGGADVAAPAIDHAIRAAEQALDALAYEDALALLERARAALPDDDAPLRARVLLALGEARIRAGDAAGRTLCVDAAAIARELGDATLLARAALAYGAVLVMGAVDAVMVQLLEDALAALGGAETPLRARVMARLAAA